MQTPQTELQAAFYRAKLDYLGYTLADALKNKAISIGLTRMVQVAQKPPKRLRIDQLF